MGFRTGAYAKIWAVKPSATGKSLIAEMSTSKKKQDGSYETDWSNKFVTLVGQAAKEIENAEVGSSGLPVRIGDCDVTNKWDSAKKIMYTNYAIFSFQKDDGGSKTKQSTAAKKTDTDFMKIPDNADDEGLPFN